MVLDEYVRDYRAFMDEFATSLDSVETHFYLDTSFLIWLIRLGAEARAEALRWFCDRPPSSVRVPVWAAHEFHRHVIDGTARKTLRDTVADTLSKYDDFVRIAAERADDRACAAKGFVDRAAFVRDLEHSFVKVRQLAGVVDLDDTPLQEATKEVIDFANNHMLPTDLSDIIHKLNFTGKFRATHLVPPGFQDKKSENAYGDLVIWEEIIQDVSPASENDAKNRDVIFVSRDRKTDWVSAAPFVLNLKGEATKGNRDSEMDVTRPHPFLVHELVGLAKGGRLYVTHPGFLASVIDFAYRRKGAKTKVLLWLAASHRPDFLSKLAALGLSASLAQPAPAPPSPATVPPAPTLALPRLNTVTLKDLETPGHSETGVFVKALPMEQEALMGDWISGVSSGTLSPFKLGRLFAEIILAGTTQLEDQIPALFEALFRITDIDRVNAAALALITAAYFDRYSELLRSPIPVLAAVTLSLETDERLKEAYDALADFLTAADAELPYSPGSGRKPVVFILDSTEAAPGGRRPIRDIRIAEQSVLSEPLSEIDPRTLSQLLGRSRADGCTGRDLRLLVARKFQIPPDLLTSDYDSKKFTWQPDAGLVALDMTSPGGLSACAAEENVR